MLLDPAIGSDFHADTLFSADKLRIPETLKEGRLSQPGCPGVCVDIMAVLALFHHLPVAKRARKGTLLGDATEAAGKFGPLKVVLGAIPAVYANREVRSRPSSRNPLLTREFSTGIRRCGEQD